MLSQKVVEARLGGGDVGRWICRVGSSDDVGTGVLELVHGIEIVGKVELAAAHADLATGRRPRACGGVAKMRRHDVVRQRLNACDGIMPVNEQSARIVTDTDHRTGEPVEERPEGVGRVLGGLQGEQRPGLVGVLAQVLDGLDRRAAPTIVRIVGQCPQRAGHDGHAESGRQLEELSGLVDPLVEGGRVGEARRPHVAAERRQVETEAVDEAQEMSLAGLRQTGRLDLAPRGVELDDGIAQARSGLQALLGPEPEIVRGNAELGSLHDTNVAGEG